MCVHYYSLGTGNLSDDRPTVVGFYYRSIGPHHIKAQISDSQLYRGIARNNSVLNPRGNVENNQ